MTMIKVMIADDERLAREELGYLLEQEKDVVLLPSATNGRELLELVRKHEPEVLFLDIKMPEMEGIQAARILAASERCPLIVCSTAYEDYAVEAFGLNAVDYLLKPTDPSRFKETMNRVRVRLAQQNNRNAEREAAGLSAAASAAPAAGKLSKLLLDDGSRLVVIDPEAILYAEREDRLINIYTLQQRFTSKMTLQQLEQKLAAYAFFRTHRSYLVNLNYVYELIPWFNGAYNVTLKDEQRTQIPVSRSCAKDLLKLLQGQ
ncbi:LytTR family DNA-binding domain-containing protein [Brevibacillus humidisoli]|uniref:LytR/AlgR family response regulator transcription factor n=1 Tax=Brevibacillus humidisoli TaxID=2895522 RepID=UPI001E3D5208|nr:LytTR family DNA-binding domain-containing protein [Brevibacillus humidisoli]UFJ41496.1 LytTR family DNA-binding domain-containing protein [Brevibacillus humidisoli]